MKTVLDNSVAILHGSANNSLSWVWLSPKYGRVSLIHVEANQFWIADHHGHPEVEAYAKDATRAWGSIRRGEDVAHLATHHLVPPFHNEIAPLGQLEMIA